MNYDLNKTGQNYDALITYLKSHQTWAKPLKSSFFVKTTLTAGALREGAQKYIDSNDDLIVVDVTGRSWSSWGLPKEVTDWLYTNL